MRILIPAVLLVATAIPGVATAQSWGELQRDRRDIRDERRDLDRAYRSGNPGRIRDAREDLREARREYREDFNDRSRRWGRDDWRRYRAVNRQPYYHGNWRAPFRYNAFRAGGRIAPVYYGRPYWISDPWRYRLPAARPYTRWVRHYNDVLLIDYRRGVVVDVIRGFYW